MTLAAACGWSLARSLIVALAAWPVCRALVAWLAGMPRQRRRMAWIGLLIPFLCPELWTGYAWSGFAVRLANTGLWDLFPFELWTLSGQAIVARDATVDELLLDLLLFFRAVPLGTLAMYFAPPAPLSREALYCRILARTPTRSASEGVAQRIEKEDSPSRQYLPATETPLVGKGQSPFSTGSYAFPRWRFGFVCRELIERARFALYGRFYAAVPAATLVFLVVFQEFELASLIGRPAWTVWLFDAQVGGLALSESLRLALLPILCEGIVLAPLLWMILTNRSNGPSQRDMTRQPSWPRRFGLWVFLLAGLAIVCGVPAILVGRDTANGLVRVLQNKTQSRMLFKEIFSGLAYSLPAAVVATGIAAALARRARASRVASAGVFVVTLPGLAGSLVLGLTLIQLLQLPLLRFAYKTPLSLLAGLILFLLPRAVALRLLLSSTDANAGLHLTMLMRQSGAAAVRDQARELAWQVRWRTEFWGVALLSYWVYFDLTLAYLLAPVTIVSAPVMLYNQMHFGKNATLSALVFLTVLVPVLICVAVAAARRFVFRWF